MPSFRFGPFEFDPDREELKRSGVALRLTGQPFQILRLLLERPGEVVTREEIHAAIWGDATHVGFEQGINTAIRQIRMVLGDHAEAPRYVRTIPRRGYEFIAPVERVDRDPELAPPTVAERPGRSRAQAIAAAAMALLFAVTFFSIFIAARHRTGDAETFAVAPFRTIGAKPAGIDDRAFAEELRAAIATLPPRYVTLIASPDRADVVIDGTVQRTEKGVRVIVSGVDARSHTQLWSETYERPSDWTDGMAIETAHRVAHGIARRYLPAPRHEPIVFTKVRPTTLELYRTGRMERMRDPYRAQRFFEEALVAEPRFAEGWSALADIWAERGFMAPPEGRSVAAQKAKYYAGRALELQPRNAEAWSALGMIAQQYEYDLPAAGDAFRRATVYDPDYSDAHFNLAVALTARGEFNDALREFAIARELDPPEFDLHPMEAVLDLHARRYDDALARYRESLALNRDAPGLLLGMLSVYVVRRQWPEAIEVTRKIAAQKEIPARSVPPTAEGFHELYRDLEPVILDASRRGIFNEYTVAAYYAQLGDKERALERLRRAIANHAPSFSFVLVDPRMDPLRSDPRFRTLLQGTKLDEPREEMMAMLMTEH